MFMNDYLAGRATAHDIHDYIEQWHDAPMGSPAAKVDLHEWLGMTWEQYARWFTTHRLPGEPKGRDENTHSAARALDTLAKDQGVRAVRDVAELAGEPIDDFHEFDRALASARGLDIGGGSC